MYFVDKNKIEKHLQYMEKLLQEMDKHSFETFTERLSLERVTHMVIESMLDVGNMLIDGFIMRDPGSFTDIVDILSDENVLPKQEATSYKEVIELRKMLVRNYLDIDHEHILILFKKHEYSLHMFSKRVRTYLETENQVATAFSNDRTV